MLNASVTADSPTALPWAHLDIPHRVAIVIGRTRPRMGEGICTEQDFVDAPETCELPLDTVRANIGKATLLLDSEAPAPAYDRQARISRGAALVLGLMPQIGTIHTTLREAGYTTREVGDLWPEIISRAADDFDGDRAPKPVSHQPPAWASEMLARNAE